MLNPEEEEEEEDHPVPVRSEDEEEYYEEQELERMMFERQRCRQRETEEMHFCLTKGMRMRAERLAAEGRTEKEEEEEIVARLRRHYEAGGGKGKISLIPFPFDPDGISSDDGCHEDEEGNLRQCYEAGIAQHGRRRRLQEEEKEKKAKEAEVEWLQVRGGSGSVVVVSSDPSQNVADIGIFARVLVCICMRFTFFRQRWPCQYDYDPTDTYSYPTNATAHCCSPSSQSKCAKETAAFNVTFRECDLAAREAIQNEEERKRRQEERRRWKKDDEKDQEEAAAAAAWSLLSAAASVALARRFDGGADDTVKEVYVDGQGKTRTRILHAWSARRTSSDHKRAIISHRRVRQTAAEARSPQAVSQRGEFGDGRVEGGWGLYTRETDSSSDGDDDNDDGKTHKDGLRIRSRCLFNTSKLRNVFCGFVATCLSHILAAFIESNSLDIRIRNI